MRDKYSGLQIGIHWLVFLLVVVAYAAMELRGFFPRSERPLINMDGGASAGAAEIAGAADRTETIADDDRFRPSWSPGDLFAVHCLAVDRHGDDVLAR